MKIVGIIVAAGRSTRMGAPKPFLKLGVSTLIEAVIARVRPQVETLLLNLPDETEIQARERFGYSYALVADAFGGARGPLGGVVAGLRYLSENGGDYLASFPGDTPFLPDDLVLQLTREASAHPLRPVVAIAERPQNLCALWPRSLLEVLERGVREENFVAVKAALAALDAVPCKIDAPKDAFFNVNTQEDLAYAAKAASEKAP
jgi:molybdopterin-guanine dinucleotide biosynthesis protein A